MSGLLMKKKNGKKKRENPYISHNHTAMQSMQVLVSVSLNTITSFWHIVMWKNYTRNPSLNKAHRQITPHWKVFDFTSTFLLSGEMEGGYANALKMSSSVWKKQIKQGDPWIFFTPP